MYYNNDNERKLLPTVIYYFFIHIYMYTLHIINPLQTFSQ